MIAELVKEDENYSYRVKSKGKVVMVSKYYTTKIGAVRGFKNFNRSAKLGRITVCNDEGCYHVEVVDGNNRIIAESINLENSVRVTRLRNTIKTTPLILKDRETKKMRTYIENIGDIQLKEPLTVVIEKSSDYLASIDRLKLFAYGENLKEVIDEINYELTDLYSDLFNGEFKLAKPALEMKSYIENLLT